MPIATDCHRLGAWPTFGNMQVDPREKAPISGAFAEPSDGLEPSTPSLPWNISGNQSQPTATVFACFRGFGAGLICH
jgi:hypothetical protein